MLWEGPLPLCLENQVLFKTNDGRGLYILCKLICRLEDLFFKRKALCMAINGSVCDSLVPGVHACQPPLSSVEPWPSPVTQVLGHLSSSVCVS